MEVVDATGAGPVPHFWDQVGWARPYHFLRAVGKVECADAIPHAYLADKVVSGYDFKRCIERKSLASTGTDPISSDRLNAVLRCVYQALSVERDIVAGVVTWNVKSWADAAWVVEHEPRSIRRSVAEFSPDLLSRVLQGQVWAQGTGIYVVLCLDWKAVHASGDNVNAAYANALVKAGRIGHALVLEGQHEELVARMTPAVHESSARTLFRLSEDVSPIYAIRLAHALA